MKYFCELFNAKTFKVVLSKPKKNNISYKKVVIDLFSVNKYLVGKYTKEQVFHTNMTFDEASEFLLEALQKDYSTCNAWDEENEYSFYVDRVGNINFSKKKHSITAATMPRKTRSAHGTANTPFLCPMRVYTLRRNTCRMNRAGGTLAFLYNQGT